MKIILITFSILFLEASISNLQAQETGVNTQEERISSEIRAKQAMIKQKNKIMSSYNKQIYNKKNDALMREYVRNSNAFKKMRGEPTKEIDIQDKEALSQYIQDDIGLQKEIIEVKLPQAEDKNKNIRPSAAELLK